MLTVDDYRTARQFLLSREALQLFNTALEIVFRGVDNSIILECRCGQIAYGGIDKETGHPVCGENGECWSV